LFFLYLVEASNNNLPGAELSGTNECNVCHGPSHRGHVSYTTTMNTPEVLINDTETTVSIVIRNNDFPLDSSSLTLSQTTDYSIKQGEQAQRNLGTIARGSSVTTEWHIILHVTSAKNIQLQADFTGTANDHKTFTYTNTITKSIFVSTTPTAILKVLSDPPTGSTFYRNTNVDGTIVISNVGNLKMDNVTVTTQGPIKIDGQSTLNIGSLNPGEEKTYPIKVDTSHPADIQVIISANSSTVQKSIVQISIQNPPPTPLSLTIGRILGYIAYTLLLLSVLTGVARYLLRKWFSGRKLRILHADLSNLGFTLVVIHAITLIIPNSPWTSSYRWFQILPTGTPSELTAIGLELGRWGLLVMYISVLSGYYFSSLVKKFGRKVGIRIHMLSYLALIGGMIHAVMIGGTASKPLVTLIFVISLLSVLIIKIDDSRRKNQKREQRKELRSKRVETIKEKDVQVPAKEVKHKEIAVAEDARSGTSRTIGIVCWNCLTLNDEDAVYCKSCGKTLIGKVCTQCQTRNDDDATYCKKCGKSEFKKLDEGFNHE